jgi:hypothetical protein
MNSVKLRDYQALAVDACVNALDKSVNPLLVAPTGAGKTVMACEIMNRWQYKHEKMVFFFAHREELLEQAQAAMDRAGVTGKALSVFKRHYNDIEDREGALCVFDEAHHAVASSWQNVSSWFEGPKVAITATPDRLDRQCLTTAGFALVHEISIRTLIADGHLVRPLAHKLGLTVSDRILDSNDAVLAQLARNVLDEFARYDRKRAIVFLPTVDSSTRFSAELRKLGASSAHLDGGSGFLRGNTVNNFKAGNIDFLCNVGLFTEGFDCPEVDCVILLRETKSRALWSQMIGRGLRTSPGKKDCLVLDPMWVSGSHALVAADAFTAHPDSECKPKCGMSDPLDDAIAEDHAAEDRLIAKLKKLEKEQMSKDAKDRGLVDLSIVTPLLGLTPPPLVEGEVPMTDAQRGALERFQVFCAELGKEQASFLLTKLHQRQALGLASVRQVKRLRQFGHARAATYTFQQASAAMAGDWRVNRNKERFRKVFTK